VLSSVLQPDFCFLSSLNFYIFFSFFLLFNPTANDKTEQLPDNVQTQK